MKTKLIKNSQCYSKSAYRQLETLQNANKKHNFFLTNRDNLSKHYYEKILAYDLLLKQNYNTIMQIPRLHKIVLNTTSRHYTNDKKLIIFTLAALELISGQKPQLTLAKNSIANFKIRQDQILGCKVVLQKKQLYTFFDKLSKIIFPRVKDYSKTQVSNKKKKSLRFAKKKMKFSTYNLGFHNPMIFPELETNFELVESFHGLNVTFVFYGFNQKNSALLLSGFQVPFLTNMYQ